MKKLFILLFSLLISFNSYGGWFDKTVCVETDNQIICKYENGQKSEERNYKDGKQDGKWTEWDENGQIKSEATYKDGECVSGDCDYFKSR